MDPKNECSNEVPVYIYFTWMMIALFHSFHKLEHMKREIYLRRLEKVLNNSSYVLQDPHSTAFRLVM